MRCKKVLDSEHPFCPTCKLGSLPLPKRKLPTPAIDPRNTHERLGKRLAEQRGMLGMAQRVWFSELSQDPEHEPLWKRRRCS